MIRLLHLSDTHLGARQYGSDVRQDDMQAAFERAIEIAIDRDVDGVVHTGDLFDSRTPSLPVIQQAIKTLRRLADAEIPFYGIVGNHDRKREDQWLDLLGETGTAERLDTTPTMVGDVALYGIDAVTRPAWHATDFSLTPPPDEDAFRILCLHQMLAPPVGAGDPYSAEHSASEVLERAGISVDALALGDVHEAKEGTVDGVPVWYAGSTERTSVDQRSPRTVSLLEVENDQLRRTQIELDVRPFREITISFGEGDTDSHVRDTLAQHDLDEAVAYVRLTGDRTSVTSSDVYTMAREQGARVCKVRDDRGREDLDLSGAPGGDVRSPDAIIADQLADADLSELTMDLDVRIREDDSLPAGKYDVADVLREDIEKARARAFGGDAAPEAVDTSSLPQADAVDALAGARSGDGSDRPEDDQ
jgi:exonuclease SbcD